MNIKELILNKLKGLVMMFNGKKTTLGATSLILWVTIYAMPAFTPDYNWITVEATRVRDALQVLGFNIDNELFNVGAGLTVVGLIDKIRKLFIKPTDTGVQP